MKLRFFVFATLAAFGKAQTGTYQENLHILYRNYTIYNIQFMHYQWPLEENCVVCGILYVTYLGFQKKIVWPKSVSHGWNLRHTVWPKSTLVMAFFCWWQIGSLVSSWHCQHTPRKLATTAERCHQHAANSSCLASELTARWVKSMLMTVRWVTSMLVTDVADKICWWQLWDVGDTFGHFAHQHSLSFYNSVGPQQRNSVTCQL